MVKLDDSYSILIVDDDKSYRSILSAVFSDGSYTVSTAEDGQDALNILERNPFDLIITDLQMPKVDGLSLIQAVKSRFPDTRVLVMSAYSDNDQYKTFLNRNNCPCLAKPFRRTEVLNMANSLLTPSLSDRLEP